MSPREHHVVQPAVGLVDAILRRENGVIVVWVTLECLRVDNLVRELAADDKRILYPHKRPSDEY